MTRFRISQFNNSQSSCSDYTNKIKNRETLKFARSISSNDKTTHQFMLDCTLRKEYIEISGNKTICCSNNNPALISDIKEIWQPAIYIAVFNNFNTMINLLLEQATLDKNCSDCADVPSTLNNGLTSEFCFDDKFNTISNLSSHPCKCLPLHNIDICQVKSNTLYPHGHFNNNDPSVNKGLRRRLILNCNKKEPCPTYIYCKCPPNEINCRCCDYTVSFPFRNKTITYMISGCDEKIFNLINFTGNPNSTYSAYAEQIKYNEIIKNKSISSFSRQVTI